MENLTLRPTGWDKLATLIEGQSMSGLSNAAAAGLLKLLINTQTNYSYRVAASKSTEFNPNQLTKIRLLLADSLDDCYASGEIATWVAFNYEYIDEQVMQSIRVLDLHSKPNDNIKIQLQASKLFFAQNDDERLGGILICRVLCEPEWLSIFKEHDIQHKSQVNFADFQRILG
jgi:hypothetical protein